MHTADSVGNTSNTTVIFLSNHPQSNNRTPLAGRYISMPVTMLKQIAASLGAPESARQLDVSLAMQLDNVLLTDFKCTDSPVVSLNLKPSPGRSSYDLPGFAVVRDVWQGKVLHCWMVRKPSRQQKGAVPTLIAVLYTPETAMQCYQAQPMMDTLELRDTNPISERNGLSLPGEVYYCLYDPSGRPNKDGSGTASMSLPRVVLTGDMPNGRVEVRNVKWTLYQRSDGKLRLTRLAGLGGVSKLGLVGKRVVRSTRLADGGLELEIASVEEVAE